MTYLSAPGVKINLRNVDKEEFFIRVTLLVANYYNVSIDAIMGNCRIGRIAKARQIAMWLCFRVGKLSQMDIARYYNRNHATVKYNVRMVDIDKKNNTDYDKEIKELLQII